MGICVKKIADAIGSNSDVSKVFRYIEIFTQKISPYKMSELATKLIDYKFEDSHSFFDEGIHKALERIYEFESERLQGNDIQRSRMSEFIVNEMGDDNDLKSIFNEIEKISREFERKSSEFNHNRYQCYIAARVIHECLHRNAFTLGSGQGKSHVAFLIAAYYKKHERSVTIVAPSK